MNPLVDNYKTELEVVHFDHIKLDDYLPTLKNCSTQLKNEVQRLIDNPLRPDFENTIVKLEELFLPLSRLSNIFFYLLGVDVNEKRQEVAQEFSPLLQSIYNEVFLNDDLFKRIESVFKNEFTTLKGEDQRLLEKTYKQFVRGGAQLNPDQKKRLCEIDESLTKLSLDFEDNVLKAINDFTLVLQEEDLEGLPSSAINLAQEEAKKRDLKGYVFTLQYPSYSPFMQFSKREDLRKKLYLAASSKAYHGENNNREITKDIIRLRDERAKILGYKNHASYVLEERMAATPEQVFEFLDELKSAAKTNAQKEFQLLVKEKEKEGSSNLNRWDLAFYTEKLKKDLLEIDDEKLKEYFPLEQCKKAMFDLAHELYSLSFTLRKDIKGHHPEVECYEVKEGSQFVGLFYLDLFPRASKRSGAWMASLVDQHQLCGLNQRPHVGIVCNFTPPVSGSPSLLSFYELTTLFHEFGHALHGLCTNCRYPSLSGTNVSWDFVELPSQIMENWCYEESFLQKFARHYQTQEPLDLAVIKKMKEMTKFMAATQTNRQLGFAYLDMYFHTRQDIGGDDFYEIEKTILSETEILPPCPDTSLSCSFSHIFAGGYSAGYYSYKWAEVLDADAFSAFQEEGIFDQNVAGKFKKFILSRGDSQDPMELYQLFRGRAPETKALLKRAGLC